MTYSSYLYIIRCTNLFEKIKGLFNIFVQNRLHTQYLWTCLPDKLINKLWIWWRRIHRSKIEFYIEIWLRAGYLIILNLWEK